LSLPFIRFTDPVYRAHHPRWAFDPVSGEGARRHGGRFNRPGTPALYTALRMEAAWLEAQQGFAFKAQPLTLCSYAVDCTDILDLSSPTTVAALGIEPADLACAWEDLADRGLAVPSWTLADRLIKEGAAGIVVPSFAHRAGSDDRNLIFWRWANDLPHKVRVIDDRGRLPRDDSSWS
jgi:RES domain-containing protein